MHAPKGIHKKNSKRYNFNYMHTHLEGPAWCLFAYLLLVNKRQGSSFMPLGLWQQTRHHSVVCHNAVACRKHLLKLTIGLFAQSFFSAEGRVQTSESWIRGPPPAFLAHQLTACALHQQLLNTLMQFF